METSQLQQKLDELINKETFFARVCGVLGDDVQRILSTGVVEQLTLALDDPDSIDSTHWSSIARDQASEITRNLNLLDSIHSTTLKSRSLTIINNCRAQQELFQR